ncbi:hypothetical protein FF011L_49880 [Roseimaritima multifibrata]|uniref:Uncharacterized protein n=1 Tax=Roseimaritima multifibrata TaxID=1930274 RepID=A0A517MMT2_9BACT|nr:hypothetical protein [Roseimaritima multifibrata]QDS96180.1 hypothetical protein FF011L_49880 [Roseimaritima multifibrata]
MTRQKSTRKLAILVVAGLCIGSTGCGLLGNRKYKECQAESERLLTDYRTERDRADRLAVQNRAMTDRVAVLEQRLATSQQAPARYSPPQIAAQPADLVPRYPAGLPSSSPSPASSTLPTTRAATNQSAETPAVAEQRSIVPPPDPWRSVPFR